MMPVQASSRPIWWRTAVIAPGAFLHTLTLADVATGWVECLPLLHRTQHAVKQALVHAGQLLPFSILGLDTDNGGEFINDLLLAYCEQQGITEDGLSRRTINVSSNRRTARWSATSWATTGLKGSRLIGGWPNFTGHSACT
jgi:hypothetical protein